MKRQLVCWIWLGLAPSVLTAQTAPTIVNVLAEFDRFAEHVVWPNFRPGRVPLAIYDGKATWLTRHPKPPPSFTQDQSHPHLWRMEGKHDAVRANTSADLGGTVTATLLVDPKSGASAREYASVLLHEAFHVFQRERFPRWGGNEVELFTYPVDDAEVLVNASLETEALRRALASEAAGLATCWTKEALSYRTRRFALLETGSVEYERGTELLEGLADYVEFRAGRGHPASLFRGRQFRADEVRLRSYALGTALAMLLDRFAPGWIRVLDTTSNKPLDELLATAVEPRIAESCQFSHDELQTARAEAASAIMDLHARRSAVRNRVFTAEGWTLILVGTRNTLLFPSRFDPWNVHVVDSTEVVHTKWLVIGNAQGSLEIIDRDVLTEGVGPHPLFNGVGRVIVPGFPAEPVVRSEDGSVVITGPGVEGRFQDATVSRDGRTLTISLSH